MTSGKHENIVIYLFKMSSLLRDYIQHSERHTLLKAHNLRAITIIDIITWVLKVL